MIYRKKLKFCHKFAENACANTQKFTSDVQKCAKGEFLCGRGFRWGLLLHESACHIHCLGVEGVENTVEEHCPLSALDVALGLPLAHSIFFPRLLGFGCNFGGFFS